jgi:hypothetical protein
LGHNKSPYYTRKEPERREIYASKCMKYLTFLDYSTLEATGKNIEAKSRKRNYEFSMDVVPVSFAAEHKSMLGNCKMLLERDGGYIAINPKFDKLITSLRTAVENDGMLDKEATSYDDIFDAFRLALHFYRLSQY